jgi:SAM-dependent methyltransferase
MTTKNLHEQQHNIEIHENLNRWHAKPILQEIYFEFYKKIASYLNIDIQGKIVELGSGIGNMKMVIPEVISTDIFQNPWIDQVENAYNLSFKDESVSNIILFDVWHHLKYPGDALEEFNRALKLSGRVIIFEPAISLLGLLVYGVFHHEPIGLFRKISWFSQDGLDLSKGEYYAAQGNATRIFCSSKYNKLLTDWQIIKVKRLSSFSYVLSGGYSKRQLYPDILLKPIMFFDKVFGLIPLLFGTRLLVVLEKNK